jgi:hypothetical protein
MDYKQFRDTNYSVSEAGAVRNDNTGRILKNVPTTFGYLVVCLSIEGQRKVHKVHRMVAECYLPEYTEELQVNHKDGIKGNNNLSNLEMATSSENNKHASKVLGGRHILVHQYSKDGNVFIKEFDSLKEASEQTGVSYSGISLVLTGRRKSSGGFFWKYGDTRSAELCINREIAQFTLEGELLGTYKTMAEAARAVNRTHSAIRACVTGRTNTCAGYKWELK